MNSVLVIEDDAGIIDVVSFALSSEGFEVASATTGADGIALLRTVSPDAVLLDVQLPDASGFDLCRRIRLESTVPVIMLTVRDAERDKVMGLEAGADDYVTKPFSVVELVSRVRAVCRRRELDRSEHTSLVRTVGPLQLDIARRKVTVDGRTEQLTPSEFGILSMLSERPGQVLSRAEILDQVHELDGEGGDRTCDFHIFKLRRKIETDPARPRRILTVRGAGYRLSVDDDTHTTPPESD